MNNSKWPCIFGHEFTREQVNSRLAELEAPLGAFTRAWRWEHCATINPYGSESCPYAPEDCALAYLKTGQDAMEAHTSKVGLFKALAQRRGLERAENKPLARDRVRTDGLKDREGNLRTGAGTRPGDVLETPSRGDADPRRVADNGPVGLRRAAPRSIGSLLWGDGEGSRPPARRGDKSQTSADDNGDARDPVPPPPSGRLGDQPPSGDPGIHQGGE